MALSRQEVIAALGAVDEELLARIAAMDASMAELVQARAWLDADEALIGEGRSFPSGRVAELINLLAREEEDEDELSPGDRPGPGGEMV